MDKRIKFYSHNKTLLPPKPKSSCIHLKQGIQEFQATKTVVVVCRLHYTNTLNQEPNDAKAYDDGWLVD